jgi:peptidoglycan hydrolase-like protein with peptidoglycan-binding domain
MEGYLDNPDSLPTLDLRNRSEGGKGPLGRNDSRKDLIEHLQKILRSLGFDIGSLGPNGDGIDELFGDQTEKSIKLFQVKNRDWNSSELVTDGLVGPKMADAMNRICQAYVA